MARVGKIARLPAKLREELNHRLLNAETGGKILPWLNTHPEVIPILAAEFESHPITDQNLSDWRRGGHADWLKQRERIARTRELAEYAAEQSRANGSSIAEGAQAIASGKLLELLEAVDDAVEDTKGGKLPTKELVDIVSALTSLRVSEQNDKKLALQKKSMKQKDRQIDLDEQKYQRSTAAIALKVLSDERAQKIEAGVGTNAQKIEAMGQHLFGNLWKKELKA